ncbi:hypothetical protein CC78DRAFT_574982 [Lojkania enalia]|uniref:Zn(2)-C6 fungal-type domain-containing protein n=1 Tax=Lojkania enalia TaxID=147567 RepID=A0A9P4NA67_9PLEO|nr:hypothetical protein CC78DRAFT_574982 [Didymosphaeria enalia]
MPRKRQGLRSYHHKSRNGCSNCKRRRVKCSMQAPACANCVRRKEVCEYQTLYETPLTQWSHEFPIAANKPSSISTPESAGNAFSYGSDPIRTHPPAGPDTGTLEVNVSLPSTFETCLTVVLNSSWFTGQEQCLWKPELIKAASKYPYVQYSLYSLSSLLYELSNPTLVTPVTAYQHHLAASSLFRQATPVVNEDNWIAVISFGVSMLVFQFATQMARYDDDFDSVESLRMLRSSLVLNDEVAPFLRKSKFWPLIVKRNNSLPRPSDHKLRLNMQYLAAIISQSIANGDKHAETNRQAFWELREWALECENCPRNWRHYISWPGMITEEYLNLVEENDDIAILILIHWAAIMYTSPRRWFITTWAQRTAMMSIQKLKGDWGDLLTWPLSVVLDTGICPGNGSPFASIPPSLPVEAFYIPVDPLLLQIS